MKLYGWAGLTLLLLSELCLFRKIEPFYSWFYCFAWWSYILLADNLLLRLRGRSLLTSRRRELWGMLLLSVFVWLLFEGYNLVIKNWAYEGVVPYVWLRWPGYTLAFATVLPGIFITSDLLEFLLFGQRDEPFASEYQPLVLPSSSTPSRTIILMGIALCTAPFAWPCYFFSTVWLGPIFLLDPLLEKLGIRSLSVSIYSGDRRRLWSLLAGGLACGVMWEFWNFWAPSRWVYTVPFFSELRIFEMPLLGFLGFPPFALECWILYHLLASLLCRRHSFALRLTFWLAVIIFSIAMFRAIDTHTVLRFGEHF